MLQQNADFALAFEDGAQLLRHLEQIVQLGRAIALRAQVLLQLGIVVREVQAFDLFVEHPEEHILIQQKFRRVALLGVVWLLAGNLVQILQQEERLHVDARTEFHPFRQLSRGRLLFRVGMLSIKSQTERRRERISLVAVVAPHRGVYLADSFLLAHLKRNIRSVQGQPVVDAECVKDPDGSGKHEVATQRAVIGDQFLIVLRLHVGVVPVHHVHILRDAAGHILRDRGVLVVIRRIAASAGGELQEHVAPHHRLQAALADGDQDFVQMGDHNVETAHITVVIQIFTSSELLRFVHPDMNLVAAERSAGDLDHPFNQGVGLLADQQGTLRIAVMLDGLPLQKLLQVRQGLDA